MKRSRRRYRAVAIGVVLSLILTAITASIASGGSQQRNPLLGPFPKKQVTLKVWDFAYNPGQPRYNALKMIDEAFMKKYPNVKIEHVGFPFSQFWPTKVQTMIAAREGADVISVYPGQRQLWPGYWPLAGLVTQQQRKTIGLLNAHASFDPGIHMIPFATYVYTWVYNKQLFQRAGLDPSKPPATWAQLLNACDRLKAAGITPIAGGFKDGYLGQWFVQFGFGSQLMSTRDLGGWTQRNDPSWDSPQMSSAIFLLQQLARRGCFGSGAEGRTLGDAQTEFNGGRAAMLYWTQDALRPAYQTLGFANVGIFKFPKVPGAQYKDPPPDSGDAWNWAITRFTKNCRVAWEYISFMYTKEAQNIAGRRGGLIPNSTLATFRSGDPNMRTITNWLKHPELHAGPRFLNAEELQLSLKLWTQLVSGQVSASSAAEQLADVRARTFTPPAKSEKTPRCT